ncbi:hypothetical protein JHK82_052810 [Glycine max]|nr:hypothetical protein JHK82_052810 [Glycine max]
MTKHAIHGHNFAAPRLHFVNWHDIDDCPAWQDHISYTLVVLYGIVAIIALVSSHHVQLAQIQLRVLEYGWTMQKVFHFLNILVNEGRCKKMQEVYNLMMGYSYSSLLHFDPELGGVGLAYSRLLFLKEEV